MGVSEFEMSPVEFAQDLQRGLIEAKVERRHELAELAITLLSDSTRSLQVEDARFLVDSRYAINRPPQINPAQKHRFIFFGEVAVEGRLLDFSYVRLQKIADERPPVESICMGLADVTMLPDGDLLPQYDVLYLPVLAITQSLRAA